MSVTGFDSKYLHAHPVETHDLAMPTRTYCRAGTEVGGSKLNFGDKNLEINI
jgi:hypothetical protein